jgi:16S rRNA (guanine1516-N2)-methyltransferase
VKQLPEVRVTVSAGINDALAREARATARRWGLPFVERTRKTGLAGLGGGPFLVLGSDGWTFRDGEASLKFTPGMAALRIKRLEAGKDEDTLVRLAELKAGDSVLDCTFGLGADALVCAKAIGPQGRVAGVEASFLLWALATEGLARGVGAEGLAPIEVQCGDHLDVLRGLSPKSFDVVLFDPMFGRPQKGSPAFEVLRQHADRRPISPDALMHARRVARRWVLVKGAKYSKDLKALGLTPEPGSRFSNLVWARVKPI